MLILEAIWSGANAYFNCADGIGGNEAKAIGMHLWSAPIRFRHDDDLVFRLDYDGGTEGYAYYG